MLVYSAHCQNIPAFCILQSPLNLHLSQCQLGKTMTFSPNYYPYTFSSKLINCRPISLVIIWNLPQAGNGHPKDLGQKLYNQDSYLFQSIDSTSHSSFHYCFSHLDMCFVLSLFLPVTTCSCSRGNSRFCSHSGNEVLQQ